MARNGGKLLRKTIKTLCGVPLSPGICGYFGLVFSN